MAQKEYNLNQGQKAAAEAFFTFLFSDDKEFIISGPAGVGKTYLMNFIVDCTMPRYHETCKLVGIDPVYTQVVMTATTNKAADVLAQATRRPAGTIHSFLNLTVRNDYSTGKTTLNRTRNWEVHQNKIIFIDECSMIDSDLYRAINEGTVKCKIVYVGDHCQLAPVQEKLSPVYRQNSPFYELTEQMRNSGQPALMAICQQLRETVETGVFKPIQIIPGVINHVDDYMMERAINHYFGQQTDVSRILAYTNNRVIQYNDHIRDIRGLPVLYQPGEYLVNNGPVKIGRHTLPAEATVKVLKDHGASKIDITPDVMLDVQRLQIMVGMGMGNADCASYADVMVPTNRDHFTALVKYFAKQKQWDRHFHLKETYPDLRPRDAATVHKSQGSTYETTFIDLSNISTCNMADQVARMLYVAFSRAKHEIVLYGDLASKYGGLIQ